MSVDYETWNRRFTALSQKMEELHKELNDALPGQVDRLEDIRELVKCLQIYATGTYNFFEDGFNPKANVHNKLTVKNRYPVEHALRSIIYQGYEDVKLYDHIFRQRSSTDATLKKALDIADKLAWDALQPAMIAESESKKALIPKETTVLTYFHKIASIRIIPYAPVALIGIPYTALNEPIDFLAIPHEVGHYVFRRAVSSISDNEGATYKRPLRNKIYPRISAERVDSNNQGTDNRDQGTDNRKYKLYLQDWLEEIFADVYGCLVAGPVIALDFQDLQLDFSGKRFSMNDGEHPSPIIRPHIYNKVLEKSKSPWADWLEALWVARREEREKDETDDTKKRRFAKNCASKNQEDFENIEDLIASSNNPNRTDFIKVLEELILPEFFTNNSHWGKAIWWGTYRTQELPFHLNELEKSNEPVNNLINAQTKSQEALYEPFRDQFMKFNQKDEWVWIDSPAPSLPGSLPKVNPFHGFSGYNSVIDGHEINSTELEKLLSNWPEPFFPGYARPVAGEKIQHYTGNPDIDEEIWWVWDVLFRAGWNTFGNGDWFKGP